MFKFPKRDTNNPDNYPCFHGWCSACDEAGLTVDYVYLPKDVQYSGGGKFMGRCVCGKWTAVYPRPLPGESHGST